MINHKIQSQSLFTIKELTKYANRNKLDGYYFSNGLLKFEHKPECSNCDGHGIATINGKNEECPVCEIGGWKMGLWV